MKSSKLAALLALILHSTDLQATALRVITLSPHTTELAYAAGLGDNLVGVSAYSDYPPQAQEIEQISDYRSMNIERIVALQPDLVIAWKGGNPEKQLNQLKAFNIPIFYSNPKTLEEIASTIEALGKHTANPSFARAQADELRSQVAALRKKYQQRKPISYFYTFDAKSLMTNNGAAWPQPLFSLCGGENIFADSKAAYPMVNIEEIMARAPQAVFYSTRSKQPLEWQQWQNLIPAVKNNHVFKLIGDSLGRPTPRAIQAAEQICQYFDKIRDANS